MEEHAGAEPEGTVALLMRLSVAGTPDPKTGVRPDPVYGDQFNNAAIQGVKPEGRVEIRQRALQGRFADGTRYTLQKPIYQLTDLAYGPFAPGLMVSPRIAPQIAGIGLIEAIPDVEILRNAREQVRCARPDQGPGQPRMGRVRAGGAHRPAGLEGQRRHPRPP